MPRGKYLPIVFIAAVIAFSVMLAGCGGNAKPAASTTPPAATPTLAPPATTPPTTPTTPTTPTSPAPATFTPPANSQFQQSIIINGAAGHGSVYVSTAGDVTIQMTGAQASTSFGWRFCPLATNNTPCFDLAQTLVTDAGGNGQVTFHFPRSGNWSGYFEGTAGSVTVSTLNATLGTMSAIFLSSSQLNGTPACGTCRYETLQSGTVSVSNQVAHIVLVNADPGNPNQVQQVDLIGGAGKNLGTVTMDANDNLTADVPLQGGSGAVIGLWDRSNQPIESGFKVP
jgi:hypothetical protein